MLVPKQLIKFQPRCWVPLDVAWYFAWTWYIWSTDMFILYTPASQYLAHSASRTPGYICKNTRNTSIWTRVGEKWSKWAENKSRWSTQSIVHSGHSTFNFVLFWQIYHHYGPNRTPRSAPQAVQCNLQNAIWDPAYQVHRVLHCLCAGNWVGAR